MHRYATITFLILLFGCSSPEDSVENTLFTILKDSGVEFKNQLAVTTELNIIEYLYFYNGAGVAVGDINNDGLQDIYFVSNQEENSLYLNLGDMKFRDITEQAGVAGSGNWNTGVSMVDVNADGHLDIYLCTVSGVRSLEGKNQLFINNGDMTFTESAGSYGVAFSGYSTQAAWLDYDVDGDLDLYLLNHSVHSTRSYDYASVREKYDPLAGDRFYKNMLSEGHDGFIDVSTEVGIYQSQIGYGLGVGIGDLDQNGFPDIYVSNDFHENDYLYLNQGDGTFSEELESRIPHTSRFSMGNDIADINNDGLADIMTLDMLPDIEEILKSSESVDRWEVSDIRRSYGYGPQFPKNALQLNRSNAYFSDIAQFSGVHASDWSWSTLIADLDNDGLKDIFVSNGIYRRPNDSDYINYISNAEVQRSIQNPSKAVIALIEKMPKVPLRNSVFQNINGLQFAKNPQYWGLDEPLFTNGSAYADLDNDGDLELILNTLNAEAVIYENHSENNFLKLGFRGPGLNPFGIGASVKVFHDEMIQTVENYTSRGFMSSVDPLLSFGLGNSTKVDSLEVVWPDGKSQIVLNPSVNSLITLDYSEAVAPPRIADQGKTLFQSPQKLSFRHIENKFNDYEREPLIPRKFSTNGPDMAMGDIDNDGKQDIILGGASSQSAQILLASESGFESKRERVLVQDRMCEDTDIELFDADGDGDIDIFIGSGGSEFPLGDYYLKDRLYLQKEGEFIRAPLPDYSSNTGVVKVADYDLDGFPDIFIGSSSIPGKYGIDPLHFILHNKGNGTFEILHQFHGPMLNDAEWVDLNNDQFPELILAGDWSEIKAIPNNEGALFTEDIYNLSQESGMHTSISVIDINNDGAMDLLIGNVGLNGPHQPSIRAPLRLFVSDFDENGTLDPILTYQIKEKTYPIFTRDEITKQIVSLKKKFPDSKSYAGKTIDEIFSKSQLERANKKLVSNLAHFILINRSDKYEAIELPPITQISLMQDAIINDINQDGLQDIIAGYNFYGNRPYFSPSDAGYGDILINNGDESFKVLDLSMTGLMLAGDLRALQMDSSSLRLFSAYNNDSVMVQHFNKSFRFPKD